MSTEAFGMGRLMRWALRDGTTRVWNSVLGDSNHA